MNIQIMWEHVGDEMDTMYCIGKEIQQLIADAGLAVDSLDSRLVAGQTAKDGKCIVAKLWGSKYF